MKRLFTIFAMAFFLCGLVRASPVVGTTVSALLQSRSNTWLNRSTTAIDPGVEFLWIGGGASEITADITDTKLTLANTTGLTVMLGSDFLWQISLAPNLIFTAIEETSDTFLEGADLIGFSGGVANFIVHDQVHTFTGVSRLFAAEFRITVGDLRTVPEPAMTALVAIAGLAAAATCRLRTQRQFSG